MKKSKLLGITTLATVALLSLAACGGGSKSSDKGKEDISALNVKVKNKEKAIKGGTLNVAVASDVPFKGVFSEMYYEDTYDNRYMEPSHESIFKADKNFRITDDGIAKLKIDKDKNTATITIRKDVKWSDGVKLTIDDVIYPYYVVGNKDYKGSRYTDDFSNVVGMDDYKAGKTDKISGIKKVDDYTVEISFKVVSPEMNLLEGGICTYAAPKHVLEKYPIAKQDSSDPVRKNPVTLGPYYMSKIVTGESVEYKPNKYYYGGKPKLDKIVMSNVSTKSVVESLKAKKYDLVFSMPTDVYPSYKDSEGYQMLGRQELAYTYLGFKVGKFDKAKNESIMDPNAKMNNKSLRQAMAYAVDNQAIGDKYYHGLRTNATTLIPTIFKEFHNNKIKGYTINLKKAKSLLDKAGYKDKDDDGFREDPNGKKLVINFASMSGGETAQPLADYYIQQWKEIGLNVKLTTGRLLDFQSFYDKVKQDNPEVDVFQGAWGVSSAPNPSGLYGRNAPFNYSRFTSKENDELLAKIASKEAFDEKKQKEYYDEWQEYMYEQAYVVPTLYRNEIMPVNNRVKGLDWSNNNASHYFDTISVTSNKRK